MKDGRTHLAHKAEHAIDLETGAIVGVTVQNADEGDTTTIQQTLPESAEQLDAVAAVTDDAVAVIEEKGPCVRVGSLAFLQAGNRSGQPIRSVPSSPASAGLSLPAIGIPSLWPRACGPVSALPWRPDATRRGTRPSFWRRESKGQVGVLPSPQVTAWSSRSVRSLRPTRTGPDRSRVLSTPTDRHPFSGCPGAPPASALAVAAYGGAGARPFLLLSVFGEDRLALVGSLSQPSPSQVKGEEGICDVKLPFLFFKIDDRRRALVSRRDRYHGIERGGRR